MAGLLWLLLWAGLFVVMMRFGCGAHMAHGNRGGQVGHDAHTGNRQPDAGAADLARVDEVDPVCGMPVPSDTGYVKPFQGRMLRFCSRRCLDTFEAAPERYLAHAGGVR